MLLVVLSVSVKEDSVVCFDVDGAAGSFTIKDTRAQLRVGVYF